MLNFAINGLAKLYIAARRAKLAALEKKTINYKHPI